MAQPTATSHDTSATRQCGEGERGSYDDADRPRSRTLPQLSCRNARVAFWIIPNIEHFRFDKPFMGSAGPLPDVPSFAQRDYGPRVGIWRMMESFDKFGLRATVALNADVCKFNPQIIRAGVERQWEWMGHGVSNSERVSGAGGSGGTGDHLLGGPSDN